MLSVNDTGMTKKTHKHCLDPFYTIGTIGRGRGIGLSIVNGMVNQYQGSPDIQSCVNQGTSVTISLLLNSKASEN